MILAGKCPPEEDELAAAKKQGFERVELYLEKHHLESVKETAEVVEKSSVEAVSVHTPHATLKETDLFIKADQLASRLEAYLVFHSQFLQHVHIPDLEKLDTESEYGYENQPGTSLHHLQNAVLKQDHELVLDTAHLFMAETDFQESIKKILSENLESINVIHLCDSTKLKDGLGFGEGEIDLELLCRTIAESDFDGTLVFEVMPEDQKESLEKWKEYTS